MKVFNLVILCIVLIFSVQSTHASDVLVVDDLNKNAYFGWYRTSQIPNEGWDILQDTIDWIDASANDIALFTYSGTLDPSVYGEKDSIATYNWLRGQGYNVTVFHQSIITTGTFSSFDLAIYPNVFPHSPTNLLNQNVSLITMSPGQTGVMNIGENYTTTHEYRSTSYVVDNSHYITQSYALGALTFSSPMWTDGIQASGNGRGIVVAEMTVVPEPISSTLFIVGGATLGFRRFRKKRNI